MKRSGFKPKGRPAPVRETDEERAERKQAQARAAMNSVVPRAAKMGLAPAAQPVVVGKAVKSRKGKYQPNKEERAWMDAIVAHGCVCCEIDGVPGRPAAVHHILSGGHRMGHLFTLPLCDPGHHQNGAALGMVSRHPWKTRFEERYGTELDLLYALRIKLRNETESNKSGR